MTSSMLLYRGATELAMDDSVSIDNVVGHERIKDYIALVLSLMKADKSVNHGLNPYENILLYGPPGTGKTRMVEIIAKSLGLPCFVVSAASFISPMRGVGGKKVADAFAKCRSAKPCIFGIDEIEVITSIRSGADANANDALNQLLTELTRKDNDQVLCIGMTNLIETIDPAIKRPGRFNQAIHVSGPDTSRRVLAFELYVGKAIGKSDDQNIDYGALADMTAGMSYAAIEVIVSNGCKDAFRHSERLETKHLVKAIIDMRVGVEAGASNLDPKVHERFVSHLVAHVVAYGLAVDQFVFATSIVSGDDIRSCGPSTTNEPIIGIRDWLVEMFSIFMAGESDNRLMSTNSSLFIKFDLERLLFLTKEVLAMLGASIGYSSPEITAAAMRAIARNLRAAAKKFYDDHIEFVKIVRRRMDSQSYMSRSDLVDSMSEYATKKGLTYSEMQKSFAAEFSTIARSLVGDINTTIRDYITTPKAHQRKLEQARRTAGGSGDEQSSVSSTASDTAYPAAGAAAKDAAAA